MGLITGILTLPLAPLRGVVAVAEQIRRQAEDVYYDPAAIRRELEDVNHLRQTGELDDATATAMEEHLIERLMAAQERTGHG
ncbi:MAG: gas vesicle protein GvpG [Intrasporangium sp.]|uniref:gas vesicle protein GvpG n=1 Tax=Intrasporangium sp. TaxID=1925024 RepID=UPI003F7FDF3B